MTELEAEDGQTIYPPSRQPECRCDVAGGRCACEDDGTTGEPREFDPPFKPEVTSRCTGTSYVGRAREIRGDCRKATT